MASCDFWSEESQTVWTAESVKLSPFLSVPTERTISVSFQFSDPGCRVERPFVDLLNGAERFRNRRSKLRFKFIETVRRRRVAPQSVGEVTDAWDLRRVG